MEKLFKVVLKALMRELSAVFGPLMAPGGLLFFQAMFIFILTTNFLGLFPYVFTRSRHLLRTQLWPQQRARGDKVLAPPMRPLVPHSLKSMEEIVTTSLEYL